MDGQIRVSLLLLLLGLSSTLLMGEQTDGAFSLTATADQYVTISEKHLPASEQDSSMDPDQDEYRILRPLEAEDSGHFSLRSSPNAVVVEFTQEQIQKMDLVYVPPAAHLVPEERTVTFTLAKSSPDREEEQQLHFRVRLLPLEHPDHPGPRFRVPNPTISATPTAAVNISRKYFEVEGFSDAHVQFMVTEEPAHGSLVLLAPNGKAAPLTGVAEFTNNDVQSGLVVQYLPSNPGSTLEDTFEVMATDSQGEAFNRIFLRLTSSPAEAKKPAAARPEVVSLQVGEGQRVVLTSDYFSYALSGGGGRRSVTYTLMDAPVYGTLVLRVGQGLERELAQGDTFRQDDANQGRLEYRAASEIGLRAVTDRVPLTITDSTGSRYRPQLLAISIAPEDNQAPMVAVNGEIVVREGESESLPASLISVSDPDTPTESLLFVLDTPPTFGFLEANYSGVVLSPAGQFPAQALELGAIRYVQSFHLNSEPSLDALFFHVTDGINKSPSMRLNISIELVNDEMPILITEVMEVDSALGSLIKNSSLFVSDFDTPPSKLVLTLLQEPKHGAIQRRNYADRPLANGEKVNVGDSFTYLDVIEELLIYEPNLEDSMNQSQDSAVFSVSDGDFMSQAALIFNFTMSSSEAGSFATHIVECVIDEGGSKALVRENLWFHGESDLHFILMEISQPGLNFELKAESTWTVLKPGDHFDQQNVLKSAVRLIHKEGFDTKVFTVKIRVEGSQSFKRHQVLFVKVRENLAAPWVDVNTGLEVPFSSSVHVTADQLSALDLDSEAKDLHFKIMDEPLSGWFEINGSGRSQQWTQNDLQHGNVQFHHNGKGEVKIENFVFEVTDGSSIVPGTMSIQIKGETQKTAGVPKLSDIRPLKVNPGGRAKLTQFQLQVTDDSATFADLVFDIFEPADHGKIELQKPDGFAEAYQFSMLDILEGNVFYLHEVGKSDSSKDKIQLVLTKKGQRTDYLLKTTKATISAPIVLPIEILESGGPILIVNSGLDYLERVDDKVSGYLSIKHLDAVSKESPAKKVIYTVTTPPSHGLLYTSATLPDSPVSVFSQDDVNAGRIYYQLDDNIDTTQTSDEFKFEISDSKSKTLTGNVFRIQWAWINFDQMFYNISETSDELRVKIVKEGGFIKDSSTVECTIVDNSITEAHKEDFHLQHAMVQFDNFDSEQYCVVKILDNRFFQGKRDFTLEIFNPTKAILGPRGRAQVFVFDEEDQPQITFRSRQIAVAEDQGPLRIEIFRNGDLNAVSSVICSSISGSAKGSENSNFSPDFMTRPKSRDSTVVFAQGASSAYCEIDLVDDALYENPEDFYVILSHPGPNSALGTITKVKVIISGPNDVSLIYFSQEDYEFNENSGIAEIAITRSGSDLSSRSSVWCTTQPIDARPNEDYVPISQQVMFERGESEGWCRLSLIDDNIQPTMEGAERLHVILSSPDGSSLSEPSRATVVIDDTTSDIPTFEFEDSTLKVPENESYAQVVVLRHGDTHAQASVKCFTRNRSARPGEDYVERPRSEESRVEFKVGQVSSNCSIRILDDGVYEGEEDLVLGLSDPIYFDGEQEKLALIGDRAMMRVYIVDKEDTPRIDFEKDVYVTDDDEDSVKTVNIKVIRVGDTSTTASVSMSTRDGSAKSGSDYYPLSKTLTFHPQSKHLSLQLTILPSKNDDSREERFYLTMQNRGSENQEATVVIRSKIHEAIVLPSQPIVASLLHYDNASTDSSPEPGYPLICISPCERRHPHYEKTKILCEGKSMTINYFWEVATPNEWHPLRYNPFKRLSKATIYTEIEAKVLDPIYFSSGFNVRCAAQPMKPNGRLGVPIKSQHVTISASKGFCKKEDYLEEGLTSSHTFNANLKYVNATAENNPNTVHIKIEIPHSDGMVPLISTQPLHNVQTLMTDPMYIGHHTCSNLLVDKSFLKLASKRGVLASWPYQFDEALRGDGTVDLYRNLDMRTCLWKFNAWFHMTELLDFCHGKIISEFKVADGGKSQLTVEVPLFVSYVSASGAEEWTAVEHRTAMEVSFVYSPLMWHKGLQTEPRHSAKVKVTRVSSNEHGQLVLEFSTQALFRGHFILSNHKHHSSLMPPRNLASMNFRLEVLWTENTWDGPKQQWKATSETSLTDFSGQYHLMLVPCTVSQNTQFKQSSKAKCTSHQPVQFPLNVNFQVPARPVPAKYSLQTEFQLTNNPKQFLASPEEEHYVNDEAWQFSQGELVYGKVRWHPAQDLKDAYRLTIDKVLLCSTKNGAESIVDPVGDLYGHGVQTGCLQPSKVLAHKYVLLDRENPEEVDSDVEGVSFDAHFAKDLATYKKLEDFPGVDGFIWKVDPLYQVNSGQEWLLQVLYRIRATSPGRLKRSDPDWQSGYVMKGLKLSGAAPEKAWMEYSLVALSAAALAAVIVGLFARTAIQNSYAVTTEAVGV